jgi:uncharacterized protein (DUF305 family)
MRGTGKSATRGGATTRAIKGAASACAVSALLVTALAAPAAAGHGAVSYENPTKIAEKKRREKEAQEQGTAPPPQAAPAAAPPKTAPAPAVASPAGAWEGNQDKAYAASARQHLSDATKLAEEQIAAGKDPQLSAIARRIVENNKKEMAEIDRWLAAHP